MATAVEQLKTKADCDLALQWLAEEKDNVSFERLSDSRDVTKFGKNAVAVNADLLETDATITALNTVVTGLPAGDFKDKKTAELSSANTKKLNLLQRKKSYGVVALVKKEMEVTLGDLEVQAFTAKEAEVNARKAALPS